MMLTHSVPTVSRFRAATGESSSLAADQRPRRVYPHIHQVTSRLTGSCADLVRPYRIVIIDSTRRGKRFPDALSKTIPIWCAVLNVVRADLRGEELGVDAKLWTLPTAIGRSEHAQIDAQIKGWATTLLASSYDLSHLKTLEKPLRPIFVSPASTFATPTLSDEHLSYYPIICVSASKMAAESDTRERGFAYAQGGGDDAETWAKVSAGHSHISMRERLNLLYRVSLPISFGAIRRRS